MYKIGIDTFESRKKQKIPYKTERGSTRILLFGSSKLCIEKSNLSLD